MPRKLENDPWATMPTFRHDAIEDKLAREHTSTPYKYSLDNYTAYIQHELLHTLPRLSQVAAWNQVSKLVWYRERTHFKRAYQSNREFTQDRVVAFYDWANLWWFKNPPWIRFSYEKNFAGIEAVLQCRRLGVGLPHDTCLLNAKTKWINYFVIMQTLERQQVSFYSYWTAKTGRVFVPKNVEEEFFYYEHQIKMAIQLAVLNSSVGIVNAHHTRNLVSYVDFVDDGEA